MIERPRIICAGLMKTGTSSLRYAVKALGWSAIGYYTGGQDIVERFVRGAINWDAVFDLPAAALWRELADTYPHAKVILTVRDRDAWLDSMNDWLLHFPFKSAAEKEFAARVFGRGKYRSDFAIAQLCHDREVKEWGEQNPDRFLLFDVIGGHEWEELCPFLGVPIPTDENGERLEFPRVRPGAPRSTWRTAGVKPVGEEGETWRG